MSDRMSAELGGCSRMARGRSGEIREHYSLNKNEYKAASNIVHCKCKNFTNTCPVYKENKWVLNKNYKKIDKSKK